ncbi:hypothetical protein D9M72_623010 [compost metagenome]
MLIVKLGYGSGGAVWSASAWSACAAPIVSEFIDSAGLRMVRVAFDISIAAITAASRISSSSAWYAAMLAYTPTGNGEKMFPALTTKSKL